MPGRVQTYLRIVLLIALSGLASPVQGQVTIIAHPSVPQDTIAADQLLDVYTFDLQMWTDGLPVVVVDLKQGGVVKDAFYDYLGKSPSRMKSIWLKRKLAGEGDPPAAMRTEAEVLDRVRSTPGAIGYVGRLPVDGRVKVLAVINAALR